MTRAALVLLALAAAIVCGSIQLRQAVPTPSARDQGPPLFILVPGSIDIR